MPSLPRDFGVLVTRPVEQADSLCELIEGSGGRAIRAPMLEIEPILDDPQTSLRLMRLDKVDWLIFVSVNAVRCAFELLGPQWLAVRPPRIAAIGLATARALAERGVAVDLKPKQQFNSESLLSEPAWEDVTGQRFLIVRGKGGRELLAETLRRRGGSVEYVELYRRVPPPMNVDRLLARWRTGEIAVVTLTSGEALDNLCGLVPEADRDLLLRTPLVVIGERLAARARQMGFGHVIAAEARNEDIFDAVARIARVTDKTYQPRG